MRISDWSSDVCSSDLQPILHLHKADIVIGVIEREPVDRIPALHQEPGAYAQPCDDRQRLPVHIYPGSEPVDPLGKAYPARQILQRAAFQHPLGALMPAKQSATGNAMKRLDEIAAMEPEIDRKSQNV